MNKKISYGDYPNLAPVKKVLIIKLRQLGDTLLTTPIFTALKNYLPNALIDAYVYADSEPLLKDHPAIHQVLVYDRRWKKLSLFSRLYLEWKNLRKIRAQKYDLVINLTEGDRGALAAKFSKASIRVGIDPKNKKARKFYTHLIKNCPTLRHTVEKNLDALRRIGIFLPNQEKELFLKVDESAILRMKKLVPPRFLLVHPTSRWMFKTWPVEKLRELTKNLLDNQIELVFTSGPDEIELEYIQKAVQGLQVHNLSGKLSLQELIACVHLSDVLFCVDSLPFHIASALKKPVVALFGPTSDITWGAWNNPFAKIITLPFSCRPCYQDGCGGSKISDCLVQIPVDDVYREILRLHKETEVFYSLNPSPK